MSGECQTKNSKTYSKEDDDKPIVALDEGILLQIADEKSVILKRCPPFYLFLFRFHL
jgi:hypothetical protein